MGGESLAELKAAFEGGGQPNAPSTSGARQTRTTGMPATTATAANAKATGREPASADQAAPQTDERDLERVRAGEAPLEIRDDARERNVCQARPQQQQPRDNERRDGHGEPPA
jgi:hypothetical protein